MALFSLYVSFALRVAYVHTNSCLLLACVLPALFDSFQLYFASRKLVLQHWTTDIEILITILTHTKKTYWQIEKKLFSKMIKSQHGLFG